MGESNLKAGKTATTTAGLRGTEWNENRLPADMRMSVHVLRTSDGASITGYLFRHGGERTVVCAMHPRELLVGNYVVPEILQGGCAFWVQGARSPGNDLRLEHEKALLDLAAGQKFLRDQMGYEFTVLQGTSGGGPLAAFYVQQAGLHPAERIARSPGGRPTRLDADPMPQTDGLIFLSAHPGQGKILAASLDPAVVDEMDPLQTNEALSIFNAQNGFARPPESSAYAPDFLANYRAAQMERVRRLDAFAKEILARKLDAIKRRKAGEASLQDAIIAAYSPIFQVWRTDADPRCYDLSLDPSDRLYGSLWGGNPLASNYGSIGFARSCTAESWLSNWSALSSNASMSACAPAISQPTLMIEYSADNCVFPADANQIFADIGATDKERHSVHGNHHGQSVIEGKPEGQLEAGRIMRAWLDDHNFT